MYWNKKKSCGGTVECHSSSVMSVIYCRNPGTWLLLEPFSLFPSASCWLIRPWPGTMLPANAPDRPRVTTPSSNGTFPPALPLLSTGPNGRTTSWTKPAVADPRSPSSIRRICRGWTRCAPTRAGRGTRTTCASVGSLSLLSQWGVSRERVALEVSGKKPSIWSWPVKRWATTACQFILRETRRIESHSTMAKAARTLRLKVMLPASKRRGSAG